MRYSSGKLKQAIHRRLVCGRVGRLARDAVWLHPFVYGDPRRLHVGEGVDDLVNTLVNTQSGEVWLGRDVSVGHNVCLLTGTHDTSRLGPARKAAVPRGGMNIVVGEGAWIASNATIVGPCRIGAHAVVAAGAVVVGDVPPYAVVAGIPARVISTIR